MDISKQYDEIGLDYLKGQNEFFTKKADPSRIFISKVMPSLKNKKILDIGCGYGKDISNYESLGAKEVWGLDSSELMINEAKKTVKNPKHLINASMDKMPFEDNYFDVVIGRFSIHYMYELDKAYTEISRVLKSGGILIIIAHHPFLGFMQIGAKNYDSKEIIKMQIYKNQVEIKFYNHSLKEYFSDTFFKLFFLDYFDEEPLYNPEYPNPWKLPGHIAFKAVKR